MLFFDEIGKNKDTFRLLLELKKTINKKERG